MSLDETKKYNIHCRECGSLSGPLSWQDADEVGWQHVTKTGHLSVFRRILSATDTELERLRIENRNLRKDKCEAEHQYRLLRLDRDLVRDKEKSFHYNLFATIVLLAASIIGYTVAGADFVGRIMLVGSLGLFGWGTLDDYIELRQFRREEKERERKFLAELRR